MPPRVPGRQMVGYLFPAMWVFNRAWGLECRGAACRTLLFQAGEEGRGNLAGRGNLGRYFIGKAKEGRSKQRPYILETSFRPYRR